MEITEKKGFLRKDYRIKKQYGGDEDDENREVFC